MKLTVQCYKLDLKKMYMTSPGGGKCWQIKISGDKLYYKPYSDRDNWNLLEGEFQKAYKDFIDEIDSIILEDTDE